MSKGGKPIGRHFITCGHPDFDADFWIKSQDETKARALLDNPDYRQTLQAQASIWLKVKDNAGWFGPKFPECANMLIYENMDVQPMVDVARLQSLFDLMGATLRQMCRIGSATADDPGFIL